MTGNAATSDYPTQISVADARERARALGRARAVDEEVCDVAEALGRVLTESIDAPFDSPPFSNSAMDGFALRAADLPAQGERAFRLVGTTLAGGDNAMRVGAGECLRITTGAPMPDGADTVVIKERVRVDGDTVVVPGGDKLGANVRPPGEDYRAGDRAIDAGARLTPAHLGAIASLGRANVRVARRVRVAVFSTGDELTPPGDALAFGQIYDSNRFSVGALAREAGAEIVRHAHLRDEPDTLRAALLDASANADVIVTSGGVSAGEADFLPRLAAEIGQIQFWKVRMKPGMPLLCATIGRALWFGLPGNPVSSFATFSTIARPALDAMTGERRNDERRWHARLATPIRKSHARLEFLRGRLESRADGTLWATPHAKQGSGMQRGMAEADALIVVPEGPCELAPGEVVEVLPLPGLC